MTRRRPTGVAILVLVAVAAIVVGAVLGLDVLAGRGLPFGGGVSTPTSAGGPPHFVDEAASAGLIHTYGGGPTFDTGGGVAVFDCDGDRKPDIYLAGGSRPAALFRNVSPVGGALRFERVPSPITDLTSVTGAYPIDIDGDGIVDLVVLRVGGVELLRGLGGCRFAPADDQWGLVASGTWATAFSATWEGSSRLPTLAIGNYLKLGADGKETFDCADNALYRPAADATRYGAPIPLTPGYCTLSMLFSDWDGSGRRDLRMTNDRHYYVDGTDQLWRVVPGEAPRAYSTADGWVPLQIWGMGIAGYDLSGDGYPDYYLTSQGDNKLQTLTAGPAQPTYRDVALKRGVNAAAPFAGGDTMPSTAWHPEFADVNDDGFVDLFVSKGNVSAVPDYATRDPSDLLLGGPDGRFTEVADKAGILNFDKGRGAALADFNLDGLLDLVEVNVDAPVRLWRNVGSGDAGHPVSMGGWLGVRLSEDGPNRDAIGAWLEVRVGDLVQRREVTIGGGHGGGQLGPIHVGLGPSRLADLRVIWPDGQAGPWMTVAANEFVDVVRGASTPTRWLPPGS